MIIGSSSTIHTMVGVTVTVITRLLLTQADTETATMTAIMPHTATDITMTIITILITVLTDTMTITTHTMATITLLNITPTTR